MPIRQKLFYNKLGKYIKREKIIYNATGIDIFDKKYKYLKVNYKHDDRIDDPFYLLFLFADLKSLWKFRIPSKPINLSFYNRHRKLFESNTMIRDNTVYLSETEYFNERKYSGYDINLTKKD